jgi:POT family proton-dependent oligopeptide transporter
MVGALYHENDSRRDAGFSLFYAGINVGALLGGYACIAIAKSYSWNLAFGLAAIVMTISLLTFVYTQKTMGPIGLSPIKPAEGKGKNWYQYAVYVGSLLVIPVIMIMVSKSEYTDWFMYIIGPCTLLYLFYEMLKCTVDERKKLVAALVFIIFSVLFWAFYEQSGGSLSLFAANNLNDQIAGIKLDPNGVNNSSNALFVIIFAPLLGLLWVWMSKRNFEPNTLIKFGLGFLFLALAFYIFYATRFFANEEGMTSLEVFTFAYFVITFGELCLSPIGLSIMTKLSPQKLQGVMMGMWFLASAYGQYAAGILGAGMVSPNANASLSEKLISYTDGYKQLAIYALISGVVLLAISPVVRKLMGNVK